MQFGFAFPLAYHLLEFGAIGGNQAGRLVFHVVRAFGVYQHRFAQITCGQNHVTHVCQTAFAIIAQNHHIKVLQQIAVVLQFVVQRRFGRLVFKIQAYQLLIARHHTQFDGGGNAGVAYQLRVHTAIAHQSLQRIGRLIVTRNRQQTGLTAQTGNIARHVGCAACALVDFLDFRHRHRGFGRNAVGVAKPIAV